MSFWDTVLSMHGKLESLSYYELLGVSEDASADDIRDRYYKLAKRLHPDRHARLKDAAKVAALTQVFARMGEALDVLAAPAKRAAYDEQRGSGATRLADPAAEVTRAKRDPAHPLARQLFEQAQDMVRQGNTGAAVGRLELAKQYEPGSAAIETLLAELAPPVAPEPESEAAPASVPAAPAPVLTSPRGERRESPRRRAAIPIRVRQSAARFDLLISRDLSRGGMFLATKTSFPKGTRLQLTIVSADETEVEILSEVVHVVSEGGELPPGIGVRFLELSQSSKATIRSLLESRGASSVETVKQEPLSIGELVEELLRVRAADPHVVLNVAPDASTDAVAQAYGLLMHRFDVRLYPPQSKEKEACNEIADLLRRAYAQLTG